MANMNREDDYRAGRRDEQLRQEDNSSAVGLGVGLLLFLCLGGIAVAAYLFNRSDTPVVPVVVPSTTPASPTVENRETIIREKSTEFVPVPASPVAPPDINISVPSTQPSAGSSAPSTKPSASVSPDSSNTPSSPSSATEPAPASP